MGVLDELEFRFETIKGKINRIFDMAKKAEAAPTVDKYKRLLKAMTVGLDDLFTEFDEVCTKLAAVCKKQIPPVDKDLQTAFSDFETKFYEIKAIVMMVISDEDTRSVPNLSLSQGGEVATSVSMSLPKLKLIEFGGNLLDWPAFHDLFINSVHNQQMSSVHKFMHLKACLTGEPRSLISSFRITAANYQCAWDLLVDRYNDPNRQTNAYLEALFDLSVVPREPKRLRSLSASLTEYVGGLRGLGHNVDQWAYPMLFLFRRKLSPPLRERWEEHSLSLVVPEIKDFIRFLENEVKVLESSKPALSDSRTAGSSPKKQAYKSSFPTTSLVTNTDSHATCPCGKTHELPQCPKFEKMTVGTRLKVVKGRGLCLGCLSRGHRVGTCASQVSCASCSGRHHELLCFQKYGSSQTSSNTSSSDTSSTGKGSIESNSAHSQPGQVSAYQTSASSCGSLVMLATAQAYAIGGNGAVHTITVLIDTASQGTFVTEDCIRRLGLSYECHNTPIFGLGRSPAGMSKGLVNFSIVSKYSNSVKFHVAAMVVDRIAQCPNLATSHITWPHISGLQLADPEFYCEKSIDVLLGSEWYAKVVVGPPIVGPVGAPDVMHTVFGYCLLGRVQSERGALNAFCATIDEGYEEKIDSLLRKFWEVEEPPSEPCLSEEEKTCVAFFKRTVKRRANGRYIVRLPFRDPSPELGESYAFARRRFHALENRLSKSPALYEKYRQFMRDYLDQQHAVPARHPPKPGKHYYIPHHCICKDDLSRFRVVFDCSMKTTGDGRSLNQLLHPGPKLQQSILDIILRFRLFEYCLVADIRQMYRNIDIADEDRDFQRIFWRFSPHEELKEYTLTTVTYGVSASPFLALACLRQLVEDEGSNYPRAAQVILENTFVDDVCISVRSLDEALSLQGELTALLEKGKFALRKWMSNRPEILAKVSEADCAIHPNIFSFQEIDRETLGSAILGLAWNPVTDVLSFKSRLTSEESVTKRTILSQVSKLYDPLGFISPVTFWGRWLMQVLWQRGYGWDEKLHDEVLERWNQFAPDLPQLVNFEVPRGVQLDSAVDVQLHGFSDSSEKGYAGVVYFRITLASGEVVTPLVLSKAKVAPVQKISLPRLELMGAVLMTNILMYVHGQVQPHCKFSSVVAWCDSTVALHWIKSPPHRWKTYVANRVTKIQDLLAPSHFRYVPSESNPSDLASRGAFPSQLVDCDFWRHGPKWLKCHPSEWPTDITHQADLGDPNLECEQERRVVTLALQTPKSNIEWILKFSSFSRLIKVTAYWLRYFDHLKNSEDHSFVVKSPSFEETRRATVRLVRLVQQEAFSNELKSLLKANGRTPALFRKLSPFIDSDGVIRVGGRLRKTNLPFERKHPMLLPKSHHLTQIIIDYYHLKYFHAGPLHMHCLIQDQFWILNAREVIRNRISKCVRCFRNKPKEANPKMGELPRSRIEPVSPFFSTGCDYGGPYNLLLARARKPTVYKGYICLFVCFTTRAIHLELVSDLTTEAFLAALRRFIARRGTVREIYSDCGTNFVGAKRKIGAWFEITESPKNKDKIDRELSENHIEWKLSAPGSPHLNGLMEAGIKSTKTYLKKIIGDQILTYEEFSTILTQVEAVVNSRPLSPISSDPNDFRALTPGHFLLQRPAFVLEPVAPEDLTRRYQLLQQLVKSFWDQWHHDYLCTLQTRSKWTENSNNLKVGDMVLLKEPHLDPCHWRLGRVIRVFPGEDGIVRVAEIKTSRGTYSRHVRKLCPLPFNSQ